MPNLTQNIGLKKPLLNETADIDVLNENFDVIDSAIAGKAPATHTHTKADITDFAHNHTKSEITDFNHTHPLKDMTTLGTKGVVNDRYGFYRASQAFMPNGIKLSLMQPRIYKPYGQDKPALLIEEGTTNILNEKSDISLWTKTGVTVTATGNNNYYEVKVDTSTGNHTVSGAFTAIAGYKYAGSMIVKKGTARYVGVSFSTYGNWVGGVGGDTTFDLETGTITELGAEQAYIEKINDDEYFLVIVCANIVGLNFNTNLNLFIRQGPTRSGSNNDYTGNGISNVFIRNPQVENKSFPTTYINGIRNSEIVRIDHKSRNIFNVNEGTIEIRFLKKPTHVNYPNWAFLFTTCYLDGSTERNQISFRKKSSEPNKWGYAINNNSGTSKYSYFELSDGWHTFTLKWKKSTQELWFFIDGELKDYANNVAELPDDFSNNATYLGRWVQDAYHLNSLVSDFHVSNIARDNDEIIQRQLTGNFITDIYTTYTLNFHNEQNNHNLAYNSSFLPVSSVTANTTSSSYTSLLKTNVVVPQDGYYIITIHFSAYVSSGTGKVKTMIGSNNQQISETTHTNTSSANYTAQAILYLQAGINPVTIQALNQNSANTYVSDCKVDIYRWITLA